MSVKKLGVYGSGQNALQILEIVHLVDELEVVAVFDDDLSLTGTDCFGLEILGGKDALLSHSGLDGIVPAIGQPEPRAGLVDWLIAEGVPMISTIHPSVALPRLTSVGDGTVICSGAVLNTNPQVGEACFMGPAVTVSHDTFVGALSLLSVGATIGARVDVEERAFIGAGATVMPGHWGAESRVRIGAGATVGAGAVVIHDVSPGDTVVGVPARPLKKSS